MLSAPTVPVHAGAWVVLHALQQAVQFPDTIVTKQAPIEPGIFERTAQILDITLTLAFVALAIAVIPAAWNFRKSYQKVSDLLDKLYADVTPLTQRATAIAGDVQQMTASVRGDVQRVSDAERRLQAALVRAEARARDLEALLDVAQREAEQSIVSAAATVRGVRVGMASLGDLLREAAAGDRMDDAPRDDVPGAEAADVADAGDEDGRGGMAADAGVDEWDEAALGDDVVLRDPSALDVPGHPFVALRAGDDPRMPDATAPRPRVRPRRADERMGERA